jgi:hypothetical protein
VNPRDLSGGSSVPIETSKFRHLVEHYDIHEWRHGLAILENDFVQESDDILHVLSSFRLCKSFISEDGGSKSKVASSIDAMLTARGWSEKKFETAFLVDGNPVKSPTHAIDCFKNRIALEIEWNNKDPFFDRDLNNFRLLLDLRVVSVGVIVTRCDELQKIFNRLGRGSSYGAATTQMSKLLPRIDGGGGGGCPLVVFGMKETLYDEEC